MTAGGVVPLRASLLATHWGNGHSPRPDPEDPAERPAREEGSPRDVPADAAPPAPRRQGAPSKAPEQDLLPDLRRGTRGGAGSRGEAPPARVRLVLHLLPRPGALSRPRHDRHRDVAFRRRRRRRSQLRRPPD